MIHFNSLYLTTGDVRDCCRAIDLGCSACMHGLSIEDYCKKRPDDHAEMLCADRKPKGISYIKF